MNIVITRTRRTVDTIDGTLFIDGEYVCDTAENRQTALPAGDYRVVRYYCKQYKRFMPIITAMSNEYSEEGRGKREELKGKSSLMVFQPPKRYTLNSTPCCTLCEQRTEVSINTLMPCHCPMLKPGNGAYNRTDGSIILGTHICPGCLKQPQQAFDPLVERIRKISKRKTKITLRIENCE